MRMRPILIGGILALVAPAWATPADLVEKQRSHLRAFYQDLHQNPERSGEEKRTAGKVAAELRSLGLEVVEGIGGYGVVGILRNGPGPTTLLRSDMDALPVTEETKLPYASQNVGTMHACGHDFHSTALVGPAYVMANSKSDWKGTLLFLAQPAEEVGKGARAMLKDGLWNKVPRPDQLVALHTSGEYKKGLLALTSGYTMANVDSVDVVFKGKGTHGSKPETGIDPFIEAAEFTLKLQTLLGREKPAMTPAVISVGSIHGGTKHNIIPDEVKMQLSVRTYDAELRKLLKRRIQEVALGIARTSAAPDPVVTFPEDLDAVYNDPKLVERTRAVFVKALGPGSFVDAAPVMGSEDFGDLGRAAHAPSVFIWLGERDEKLKVLNHSSRYAPDFDATAPIAIRALSALLLELQQLR